METPGDRFMKSLKQRLKDFSKTKFAIPVIIALSCLVYYAIVSSMAAVCFSNLIAPLFMLALLWASGIKRVRKLLLIGAIATIFFALVLTAVITTNVQHAEQIVAESRDGTITGTLDPWYVDKNVPFTFNLSVTLTDENAVVNSAHIRMIGIGAFSADDYNFTMNRVPDQSPKNASGTYYWNFTYTTTASKPVNQFKFQVDVNGSWMAVGEVDADNNLYPIQAPIYKDSMAVAGVAVVSALQIDFFYVFAPYSIVLAMIWWTRRARRMREKQVEKWQAEQAKLDQGKPKQVSKVASRDAAMGKTEEGFVCSECGADVPADAVVCPRCGEKFE